MSRTGERFLLPTAGMHEPRGVPSGHEQTPAKADGVPDGGRHEPPLAEGLAEASPLGKVEQDDGEARRQCETVNGEKVPGFAQRDVENDGHSPRGKLRVRSTRASARRWTPLGGQENPFASSKQKGLRSSSVCAKRIRYRILFRLSTIYRRYIVECLKHLFKKLKK